MRVGSIHHAGVLDVTPALCRMIPMASADHYSRQPFASRTSAALGGCSVSLPEISVSLQQSLNSMRRRKAANDLHDRANKIMKWNPGVVSTSLPQRGIVEFLFGREIGKT
jgi:hypothetical protein